MEKSLSLALACTLSLALLLSACGGSSGNGSAVPGGMAADNGVEMSEPQEAPAVSEGEFISFDRAEDGASLSGSSGAGVAADVKLIYRADLYVETLDFDQAAAGLEALVSSLGGYYESSNLYQGGYYSSGAKSADYTIRVPSEQFEPFLSGVAGTDNCRVVRQEKSAEDIGTAYYDTEARLKTLRIQQERLQDLLRQATTMTDIIDLENALANVEYEIEQYSSTLNQYDSLVGFATITLSLEQVDRLSDAPVEQEGLGSRMARGFRTAVEGFGDGMADLAVWFSYHFIGVLIFAALAALAAAVLVRRFRRRHPKAAPLSAPTVQSKDETSGPK